MQKFITVDGSKVEVLNALSSGPGCPAHTYVTKIGYVEYFGYWQVSKAGQFPRRVVVEV